MHPYINFGICTLPSYGLCMAAGIAAACLAAYLRIRDRGGSFDALLLIAAVVFAAGLCSAKIAYYVFSYGLKRLAAEMISGDYSGFTDSGLVYYGGLFGGVVGGYAALRCSRLDYDLYLNAAVPCIPLGHAFGRLGCLLAGCCYGVEYEGVFAVHSVYVGQEQGLLPIQAAESVFNVFLCVFLLFYTKRQHDKGMLSLAVYVVIYSVGRFFLEFFRGDLIRGMYLSLSTSQWISLLLILIGSGVYLIGKKRYARGCP